MDHFRHKLSLASVLILGLPLANTVASATKPVDLTHQSATVLQTFIASPSMGAMVNGNDVVETSRLIDENNVTHVRVQQMYAGYPVWGADGILHTKPGSHITNALSSVAAATDSMDGTFYQHLNLDLITSPAQLSSPATAAKLLQSAIEKHQAEVGSRAAISDQQTQMIVFVDDNNKAHWAYQVSFTVAPTGKDRMPARPVYIMDALTGAIYTQWNDIKTVGDVTDVRGGGFGGNRKMGKVVYDGLPKDLDVLSMRRNAVTGKCILRNNDVVVMSDRNHEVSTFDCDKLDKQHNNVYFDGALDAVNGGFSPDNDALFGGQVIKQLYKKWYKTDVLTIGADKHPMLLKMVVHAQMDNAYWYNGEMTFGDGISSFYPLTSLGVAAHEISHGFTEQHSNLFYKGQSGGMNESYSDMAAQAAEVFAYGKNNWQIGPEIVKAPNKALRYMDKPSKDCEGGTPGDDCSIDNAKQYNSSIDVHHSSGVYNRFFYLLSTTKDWDVRKTFGLMLRANATHWTSTTNYHSGACGVMTTAKEMNYNTKDVAAAFRKVGIPTFDC